MSRQIYRQEALERLSSPEQLDLLMPVTDAKGWVALIGVGLVFAAALVWGILGHVDTTVQGSGLLMRYGGFEWVKAPAAGKVVEIMVREGDSVKKNDPVIRLLSGEKSIEVVAPRDGRVLDVVVLNGSFLEIDADIVSVELPSHPLEAVIYVPASDGYRVTEGMEVKILPATENKHSANYLRGSVLSASKFPATQMEMTQRLQNEDWVGSILSLGPSLEIVIQLQKDRPLEHLYSGTPCEASVIVQQRRPIEFLLPIASN